MYEIMKRLEALEELADIPELFGFSIPKMRVEEMLQYKGREYRFFYEERTVPFMIMFYDYYTREVSQVEIDKEILQEMQKGAHDQLNDVIKKLKNKIKEKHETIRPIQIQDDGGVYNKTSELLQLTKDLSKEISVLEKRDKVMNSLQKIEEELRLIEAEIEGEGVKTLKEAISLLKD